jgi:hypothetical protein
MPGRPLEAAPELILDSFNLAHASSIVESKGFLKSQKYFWPLVTGLTAPMPLAVKLWYNNFVRDKHASF